MPHILDMRVSLTHLGEPGSGKDISVPMFSSMVAETLALLQKTPLSSLMSDLSAARTYIAPVLTVRLTVGLDESSSCDLIRKVQQTRQAIQLQNPSNRLPSRKPNESS